ncbi:hypothetical protein BJX76DRAFT_362493 [Aspergillus varians]
MKALQLSKELEASLPTLSLVDLPIPTVTPGHALVKIQYSCIHPSDRYNSIGGFPKTIFPRIPGRDYSGTVIQLKQESDAVHSDWLGKAVYGTGGAELGFKIDGPHAQYCLIPERMLVEKPGSISLVQAATIGVPFTTALRCLRRARVRPDDIVLVLGASGAVGYSTVQVAQAMGCKLVLTATRSQNDNPDVLLEGDISAEFQNKIPSLTNGKGVNVVIDTIGNLSIMDVAIHALALKGRYAWIAAPRGEVPTKLSLDIFEAYRKEIELVGCNSGLATIDDTAEEMQTLTHLFERNSIHPRDESSIEVVKLDDAIEKGYKVSPSEKQMDLFTDLRRGGGGTYGVVISLTIKAFPSRPVVAHSLVLAPHSNLQFPALLDAITDLHEFEFSSYSAYYRAVSGVHQATEIPESGLASRMFDKNALTSDRKALRNVLGTPAGGLSENTMNEAGQVGGGKVLEEPADSATNPAWKQTYLVHIVARGWLEAFGPVIAEEIMADITYKRYSAMQQLTPSTGRYLHEKQPWWKEDFYGNANYDYLLRVKNKYDP